MAPISPPTLKTVDAIFEHHRQRWVVQDKPPAGLRPGDAAHYCPRYIWLRHRNCAAATIDGQSSRASDRHFAEVSRTMADLSAIGCELHTTDPTTDGPITYSTANGHIAGTALGVVLGIPDAPKTWHLLAVDIDTGTDFADLGAGGLRHARPAAEAESQIAMHLLGLSHTLYLAVDPATQDIYGERLEADPARAIKLIATAGAAIAANIPPARQTDPATCATCTFRPLCWGSQPPAPALPAPANCRNCVHSTPRRDAEGGRWTCEKHGRDLSGAEQAAACDDHLIIPDLIDAWAKVTDAAYDLLGDWTQYETTDGVHFRNSRREHDYSSRELATLPRPLIGAGTVEEIKAAFPTAEAISAQPEFGSAEDMRRQAAETFHPQPQQPQPQEPRA